MQYISQLFYLYKTIVKINNIAHQHLNVSESYICNNCKKKQMNQHFNIVYTYK